MDILSSDSEYEGSIPPPDSQDLDNNLAARYPTPHEAQRHLEALHQLGINCDNVFQWFQKDGRQRQFIPMECFEDFHSSNNDPSTDWKPRGFDPRSSVASSISWVSENPSVFSTTNSRSSVTSISTSYSQESAVPQVRNSQQLQFSLPISASSRSLAHEHSFGSHGVQQPYQMNITAAETALSRAKRSSGNSKDQLYACTLCERGFIRKFDWKRHEEDFHERWKKFPCPECICTFWGSNSFNQHHKSAHGCKTCPHADVYMEALQKRSAWGCGFCGKYFKSWEARCEHVAGHFESGMTKLDWQHSNVICGLLHQPVICDAWRRLLHARYGPQRKMHPMFSWVQRTTGRARGLLENENPPQLQDRLEFFKPGQDAVSIVQLAHSQAATQKNPRTQNKCSGIEGSPEIFWYDPSLGQPTQSDIFTSSSPLTKPYDSFPTDSTRATERTISSGSQRTVKQVRVHAENSKSMGKMAQLRKLDKELPPPPPGDFNNGMGDTGLPLDMFENWDLLTSTIIEDDIIQQSYHMDIDGF